MMNTLSSDVLTTDVVIIGSGPVGLFSVFSCGMVGFSCHVVENLPHLGGQCQALYPEKPIYDIPGFPVVTGAELTQRLIQQAQPFNPVYHLDQQAIRLSRLDKSFLLETAHGKRLLAKGVIIACGPGSLTPKKPPLHNLAHYEGKSVFFHVSDPYKFKGKRIVIAGGGDSALDWALALHKIAARVTLIHRRSEFRGSSQTAYQLQQLHQQGLIDIVTSCHLNDLKGNIATGSLEHVIVTHTTEMPREQAIPADALLAFFGLSMDLGSLTSWGLTLDRQRIMTESGTCATNLPGCYAVGDAAVYPHKHKLILTGFSEATQAAYALRSFLFPDKAFHFQYSTTQGLPTKLH